MRGCRRVGGKLSLTASYSHRPLHTAQHKFNLYYSSVKLTEAV